MSESEEAARVSPREDRDSGYGTLLRNVAASIETTDPDAAQALARAAVTVEEMVGEFLALRRYVAATRAGRGWLARRLW